MASTSRPAKAKAKPENTQSPPNQQEQWLQPWDDDDDTSEWETVALETDQPRGPQGARFVVDLDAEQKAWLFDRAEAAGVTPIEYLKHLVDRDRASAD
jgi:hypothetical protein